MIEPLENNDIRLIVSEYRMVSAAHKFRIPRVAQSRMPLQRWRVFVPIEQIAGSGECWGSADYHDRHWLVPPQAGCLRAGRRSPMEPKWL